MLHATKFSALNIVWKTVMISLRQNHLVAIKLKSHHNNCKTKLQATCNCNLKFTTKRKTKKIWNKTTILISNGTALIIRAIIAENDQKATKTNLNSHTFSKCTHCNWCTPTDPNPIRKEKKMINIIALHPI